MSRRSTLSHELLCQLIHYDPLTGLFTWRVGRRGAKAGSRAGTVDRHGYVWVKLFYISYNAAHLAYFYMKGEWVRDDLEIDHKDRNRSNNVWLNLHPVTHAHNMRNRKPSNVF